MRLKPLGVPHGLSAGLAMKVGRLGFGSWPIAAVQFWMLKAAANRLHNRSELVDQLRDGGF